MHGTFVANSIYYADHTQQYMCLIVVIHSELFFGRGMENTTDWVNTFFKYNRTIESRKMTLNDGTTMSVQASHFHYCSPRIDDAETYESVEVGFPSCVIMEIMEYAESDDRPTETVYGWVPVKILNQVIESRGGIKNLWSFH